MELIAIVVVGKALLLGNGTNAIHLFIARKEETTALITEGLRRQRWWVRGVRFAMFTLNIY
jgi:hypothetical protein